MKEGKLVAITGDKVRKPSEYGCVYTCTPGEGMKAWLLSYRLALTWLASA